MKFLPLLGRILFSLIFLVAGFGHFSSSSIGYAAAAGVPMAGFLVPLSGVMAIAGGLSVLLGYKAKLGGWVLVLFMIPVNFMMHKFWAIADPLAQQMDMIMFMKNLGLTGFAFFIAFTGAGPASIDNYLQKRAALKEAM